MIKGKELVYKEIKLRISKNVISNMKNSLITARMCGRPSSISEEAMILILKAMEEDNSDITIELKEDLKKERKHTKKKGKKK